MSIYASFDYLHCMECNGLNPLKEDPCPISGTYNSDPDHGITHLV